MLSCARSPRNQSWQPLPAANLDVKNLPKPPLIPRGIVERWAAHYGIENRLAPSARTASSSRSWRIRLDDSQTETGLVAEGIRPELA